MARVSDDARRRMAKVLRGGYDVVSDAHGRFWLNGTLFGMDITARSEERIRNGLASIAGLIDPDTTSDTTTAGPDSTKCVCDATATHTDASATCDMSQSCRDAVACDREALLALALDIKRSYVFGSMDADELVVSRGAAYAIARRIYDACLGVPE